MRAIWQYSSSQPNLVPFQGLRGVVGFGVCLIAFFLILFELICLGVLVIFMNVFVDMHMARAIVGSVWLSNTHGTI